MLPTWVPSVLAILTALFGLIATIIGAIATVIGAAATVIRLLREIIQLAREMREQRAELKSIGLQYTADTNFFRELVSELRHSRSNGKSVVIKEGPSKSVVEEALEQAEDILDLEGLEILMNDLSANDGGKNGTSNGVWINTNSTERVSQD